MSRKTAAIIGNGPAGVLACHAALLCGVSPRVYAPAHKTHGMVPSEQRGAQYLHSHIPEANLGDPFVINYRFFGNEETYRLKIYGRDSDVKTSWHQFRTHEIGWNLRSMYETMFYRYVGLMVDMTVQPQQMEYMFDDFDFVINTAPLHAIAPLGEYSVEHVWVVNDGVRNEIFSSPNEIHYYGDMTHAAYRASRIHGVVQAEYPDETWASQIPNAVRVAKPLRARANTPGVYRLGRYGKWKKGVLVDQAFAEAMEIFQGRMTWEESQAS